MTITLTYDPELGGYACPYPDCDYAHTEAGAVRLHYASAHVRPEAKRRAQATKTNKCPLCGGALRLLLDADPRESEAKERPEKYTLLCPDCEEVY